MQDFARQLQLAVHHFQSGQLEQAEGLAKTLLAQQPEHTGLLQLRGEIAMHRADLDAARQFYERAVQAAPGDPQAQFRLATLLFAKRDVAAAEQHYREAIRLNPAYWQARANLGLLYRADGRFHKAALEFRQLLQTTPEFTTAFFYLLDCLLSLGNLESVAAMSDEIRAVAERCASSDRERDFAALMYLAPLVDLPRQDVDRLAQKMDRLLHKPARIAVDHPPTASGRLRIGYLSPDFGDHPISHVTLPIFAQHDRDRFEIIAYSLNQRTRDNDREYVSRIHDDCDAFVDLSTSDPQTAARRIAADGVAILVNLAGYMSPLSLEICSWRPAPVQAYWLGHGGGLGLSCIDYVIADETVLPQRLATGYRERIAWLPDCYHCADTPPIDEATPSRAAHGLDEGAFVYCAFNNPNKIDRAVFDVWMNILRRVPGSQLWLSHPGKDPALADNLRAAAAARSIDEQRLVFAERVPDKAAHFARHRLADLFLDTFCYTAATTAIDALWSGLPILTRPGEDFYSRICASLVTNVGLADMICVSTAEYEERAVALAGDPDGLGRIRERLASSRHSAPLFDAADFVRQLEAAYTEMWRQRRDGMQPTSFRIPRDNCEPRA